MVYGADQRGTGRPKGVPNKATSNAREAIARFVDGNAHRLLEWLDRIAEDNPKAAFDSYMSVCEYHLPKLQRTDNTNTNIGIVQIVLESAKHQALAAAVAAGGQVIEGNALAVLAGSAPVDVMLENDVTTVVLNERIVTTE